MLASAETWEPNRGWRTTGAMAKARTLAQGVRLLDGRVLVAGGLQATFGPSYIKPDFHTYGRDKYLRAVEIWSPRTGQWQPGAPMLARRVGHTMTTLADGRVLVVGGTSSEMVDGPLPFPAEVWDPATNRWTATPRPRWDRFGHAATRLSDGRVLVTGGKTPTRVYQEGKETRLASAEVYDPSTNQWTEVAPMAAIRVYHDTALLPDGRVLAVGAFEREPAEIWSPELDAWSPTPLFADGFRGNAGRLAPLPDGSVLLVSRFTVERWSPTWP
jgi:hypothetical protein